VHDALTKLAKLAAQALRVVVCTGAGVSAESGIPTFRDAQTGLWAKHDPVMLASVEGFAQDPATVWRWYDERRQSMRAAQPNAGHLALAQWEALWRGLGREFSLITQNIDDLHRRAGSQSILELHGNIWYVRTLEALPHEAFRLDDCPLKECPPRDEQGRLLRPHVVWFGEALEPRVLRSAFAASGDCDLLIVAGSSSVVYPAAAMPWAALEARRGAVVVEINPSETELSPHAHFCLRAPSGEVLPELLAEVAKIL